MSVTPEIFSPEVQAKFRKCQLKGCLEVKGTMWEPVLALTPDGFQWAHFALGGWYCGYHKGEISLDDLIKGTTSSGVDAWDLSLIHI